MTVKKIASYIVGILFVALLFSAILIFINKDDIINRVLTKIENQYDTQISYEDTSLGVDGTFPNILLSITNLNISQKSDTINRATVEKVSIGVNPIDILRDKKEIQLKSFALIKPNVSYVIREHISNSEVKNNNSSVENNPKTNTNFSISRINIVDGKIDYKDLVEDHHVKIKDIDYSGNFSLNTSQISQSNNLNALVSVSGLGVSIDDYEVESQFDSRYSPTLSLFEITDGTFNLNELEFDLNGQIEPKENGSKYILDFKSKQQDFQNLLSIVNSINNTAAGEIKASGQFSVNGLIEGSTGTDARYAKYNLYVDTDDGVFYLPSDLNTPLDISMSIRAKNEKENTAYSTINIDEFILARNNEKVELSGQITNSKEDISVIYDADIKIDELKNFDDLVSFDLRGGRVHLLSNGDFQVSDQSVENFRDASFNIDWESENIDILIDTMRVYSSVSEGLGNQDEININFGKTNFGNSDLKGEIQIVQPLNILFQDRDLRINAEVASNLLDVNEFIGNSGQDSVSMDLAWSEGIDANVTYDLNTLKYKGVELKESLLTGRFKDDGMEIQSGEFNLQESQFTTVGNLNGIVGYLNGTNDIVGTIDIEGGSLDALMLESDYFDPRYTSEVDSTNGYFEGIDVKVIGKLDGLKYDDFSIQDNLISFNLKKDSLIINNVISNSFGGKINLNGDITFQDKKSHANIKTDISNVSIVECLESLPFISQLAYPLSFINGRINSTLSLATGMDEDYNMILSELNAFALLETLKGSIRNFEPLDKINDILGLTNKETVNVPIKESKNWVSIKDGWVKVEEFEFSIDDYHFKVKGAHSLDNFLNYSIFVEVPADKLAKVNDQKIIDRKLIEKLNKYKLSKKGYIGLFFDMTGSMDNPDIQLNEIDLISATKTAVEQTIQEAKDSLTTIIDSVRTEIEETVRDTIDATIEKGEEIAEELLDSVEVIVKEEILTKVDSNLVAALDTILPEGILDSLPDLETVKDEIFKIKDIFKRKKEN